jgi:hypothetical protein
MHPSSLRAFQRDQELDLKHPSLVDLISTNKTKQTNKLPSFIDRLFVIIKAIGYRFTKHKHGAGKSPLGVPFSKMLGEFFFDDTHRIPIKCHGKKNNFFVPIDNQPPEKRGRKHHSIRKCLIVRATNHHF